MRRFMQALRALRLLFGGLGVTIVTLALLYPGLLIPGKAGRRWYMRISKCWGRSLVWLAGATIRITHPDLLAQAKGLVVMPTHASWLDIPLLYAVLPGDIRFVMKRELKKKPVLGWYLWLCGHFFLERGSEHRQRREAKLLFGEVGEAMDADPNITTVIFPEGTRSPDGYLQELQAGTLEIGLQAGRSILAIALQGCSAIIPKGRSLPVQKGIVVVGVHDPIATKGKKRRQLAPELHEAYVQCGALVRPT